MPHGLRSISVESGLIDSAVRTPAQTARVRTRSGPPSPVPSLWTQPHRKAPRQAHPKARPVRGSTARELLAPPAARLLPE